MRRIRVRVFRSATLALLSLIACGETQSTSQATQTHSLLPAARASEGICTPLAPCDIVFDRGSPLGEVDESGFTRLGAFHYRISRTGFPLDSMRGGRTCFFHPHVSNGKVKGVRILVPREPSLGVLGQWQRIGIRYADILMAVNGEELSSALQAMAVYERLKSAKHVAVQVERGGQLITIRYDFVE